MGQDVSIVHRDVTPEVIISRFSSDGIEVWLRKIGLIMVMAWCVLGCREANVDPDNGQGAMVEMTTRWDESRGLSGPWVRALAINTPTQFYGVVVQGQTVTGIASITDGTVKMLATPDPDAVTALMLDSNKSLWADHKRVPRAIGSHRGPLNQPLYHTPPERAMAAV